MQIIDGFHHSEACRESISEQHVPRQRKGDR